MSGEEGLGVADWIGIAAAAIAIVSAMLVVARWLSRAWRRTVGSRRHLARRLDALACGTTLQYFESQLGPAAFRRRTAGYIEHSWRQRHAWISALVLDGTVHSFAITSTDPKFRFDCAHLSFGHLPVGLGRSSLASAPDPQRTVVTIGARRFSAVDEHYFGNPGGYQQFLLAYNDAGVGAVASAAAGVTDTADEELTEDQRVGVDGVRAATTANTLVIGAAHDDVAWRLWEYPGVDADFVRTLRPRD